MNNFYDTQGNIINIKIPLNKQFNIIIHTMSSTTWADKPTPKEIRKERNKKIKKVFKDELYIE